ncbi:archaetidylserine decarboxylase [Gammaproteobacteria bacterium]|nr:archaetidylserine decarboxylase [Gammaproteobacteria bacterium]
MKKVLFIFLQHIVPQHLLSRLIGFFAASKNLTLKNIIIKKFIAKYNVNMSEALHSDPEYYSCFNDFFTRELKPGYRTVAESQNAIVCPADGAISAIGTIECDQLLQAKGKLFSLLNLLGGDEEIAQVFENGNFATVYLSPKDYHRVHMPFAGTLKKMIFIPGKLFSVNQVTSENIPDLFARNERAVCIFDTELGPMAVILVGAMIVAGIETVWAGQVAPTHQKLYMNDYSQQQPPIHLEKGLEVGRFKLGSTAIVLFGPNVMRWSDELETNSAVQMGQKIGTLLVD